MRISDWSSDVCSSDLDVTPFDEVGAQQALLGLELLAVLLGVVEQLVGFDGVRVLERREVVLETDRASDRSHRYQHLLDLGLGESIVADQEVYLAAVQVHGVVGLDVAVWVLDLYRASLVVGFEAA